MIQGLLGRKMGMSKWFDNEGNSYGITIISCGPCYIIDKKDNKIKIGFGDIKESLLNKPQAGYLKKHGIPALKHQKEVSWYGKEDEQPEIGEKLFADTFEIGEKINVQSISKGKGFAGVIKRWNFKGGPKSHGSHLGRSGGSIGQSSYPGRVWPGMKMPGRKGGCKVTVKNLEIVSIDKSENVIAIKGAVPGPNKSLVFLQKRHNSGSSAAKKDNK